MPVDPNTELDWRYSNSAATSGNSDSGSPTTPANANTRALGKYVSTASIADNVSGNVFADVASGEAAAGSVKYRCYFLVNLSPDETWSGTVRWFVPITGGASVKIATDPTGATPLGSTAVQALTAANETTMPAGLTPANFINTTLDRATAVDVPDLPPLHCLAFWVERTVPVGAGTLGSDGYDDSTEGTG